MTNTMRFPGPVQTTRFLSATALLGLAILAHAGCELPPCPPGTEGPYDNRDGQVNPNNDADYYCFQIPTWAPPPEPPKLGGYKDPDSPGPKDSQAIATAAILIESCIHNALESEFNINARMDALYGTIMNSEVERVILQRITCLSDSSYGWGCDRVRNCLGIASTPDESSFAEGCSDKGVAMRRHVAETGTITDEWVNCWGLQLTCYDTPYPRCDESRDECDPTSFTPSCDEFGRPQRCESSAKSGTSFVYRRKLYCLSSLACVVEEDRSFCTGTGADCEETFATQGDFFADYRAGVACQDDVTLRACVSGHEVTYDCAAKAHGLKCIDGSRPHCAADFQCDYDGKHPLPTCDGSLITVCNAGMSTTFDCKKLGFDTCDPERGVCASKPLNAQK